MEATDGRMATFRPAKRGSGGALLSGAVACLLLLRALLLVLSPDPAVVAAPGGGEGASIALCAETGADGPDGSRHAPGDRRCPICLLGDRCRALDTLAATPAVAAPPEQRLAGLVAALFRDGPSPRGRGRIGSGSPRAPPLA